MTTHYNNDPTEEHTETCPLCLETIYEEFGEWYHWDSGETECYPGMDEDEIQE